MLGGNTWGLALPAASDADWSQPLAAQRSLDGGAAGSASPGGVSNDEHNACSCPPPSAHARRQEGTQHRGDAVKQLGLGLVSRNGLGTSSFRFKVAHIGSTNSSKELSDRKFVRKMKLSPPRSMCHQFLRMLWVRANALLSLEAVHVLLEAIIHSASVC